MFLIRTAFWLSLVLLLLPADPNSNELPPRVHALEALMAVGTTVADFAAFCDRNRDVCETSGAAFELLKQKAQYGARLVHDQFNRPPAEAEPDPSTGDGAISFQFDLTGTSERA